MSDVYYIIGGVAYGIFILQFIISWVAGELDVDFDGDADFDIGDVVSFKGLIHFLMGFGGWTSIKQLLGYEITWVDWLIGFFIGLVFVFMVMKILLVVSWLKQLRISTQHLNFLRVFLLRRHLKKCLSRIRRIIQPKTTLKL